MHLTHIVGLAILSIAPTLISARHGYEGLAVREAFPEALEYYGQLEARDPTIETYHDVYARDAYPDFDMEEYQALKRRSVLQKRKTTQADVNAAETAYESKWDDIQIAENNLKRMTEGPGKVAAQKNIDKMKNARSQLGAKVNRLKDQLKRGV